VTGFDNKCAILGALYSNYGQDPEFKDFAEFNDLGLPLAYLTSEGLCELSTDGERYIEETWELFLASMNLNDTGFDELNDVFNATEGIYKNDED
jgi:phosphoketolase